MYKKKRELGPIYTDVDQLPMQTLQIYKPKVEKPKPDIVIHELEIQLEKIRHNYGLSVASKRKGFLNEDEEEEMSIKEKEAEEERLHEFLSETRAMIDHEIKHYEKAFNDSVNCYCQKDEHDKQDQEALKKSNEILDRKMAHIKRLDAIKKSLDKEVKALVKDHEKSEKQTEMRYKTAVKKYREVVKYLERELQRYSNDSTLELFRNLEKSLRNTMNEYENVKAREAVLIEELKKTKKELQDVKNKSHVELLNIARSKSRIKCFENDVYTA